MLMGSNAPFCALDYQYSFYVAIVENRPYYLSRFGGENALAGITLRRVNCPVLTGRLPISQYFGQYLLLAPLFCAIAMNLFRIPGRAEDVDNVFLQTKKKKGLNNFVLWRYVRLGRIDTKDKKNIGQKIDPSSFIPL